MFWKYNNASSSEIETLLQKQDVTLQEVMESESIINECRTQNKLLIDFLLKTEMIEELVSLTVRQPSIELDECVRFKYPNIACELLTSDVPAINERLASDEILLDKLYGFLECEPPLNPLLASYFSKIMGALIAKKTEQNWLSYQFTCLQVLDFLKAKDTFISLLLKHLGTSAIMDLMLKLMTQVESVEMRQNILNWLDSQRVMQSLVALLSPKVDTERNYNVAQLLCDFIGTARDTLRNSTERVDPDPILNTLESPETVSLLLSHIFEDVGDGKCESAIIGGIKVLLALLDVNQSSIPKPNTIINDEAIDLEHKQKVLQSTCQTIQAYLKDFHNLLLTPPKKMSIKSTVGILDPPLGNTRLQVIKLFSAIISTRDMNLLQDMIKLETFPVILELFFKYPWNNFLHTQVENCLVAALVTTTPNSIVDDGDKSNALISHLLVNCKLIEKILDAWKENDENQKSNGIRQGYMGHLISLVNKIVELCSNTSLGQYITDNLPQVAKLIEDFKDTTLKETNALQDTLLGGVYPNTSTENNDEYGDVTFPQEQMFAHYQIQQLTSHCIDGYSGFNDDAFNDADDMLQIDHRSALNFDLSDSDINSQQEYFKQICSQTINSLDDSDDQIIDHQNDNFKIINEKTDQNDTIYNSSDSDDEVSPPGIPMDIDPWQSPKAVKSTVGLDPWNVSMEPLNKESRSNISNASWADFSSAIFDDTANSVTDPMENNKEEIMKMFQEFLKVPNNEPKINDNNNETNGKIEDKTIDGEIVAAGDGCETSKKIDNIDDSRAAPEPSNTSLSDGDNRQSLPPPPPPPPPTEPNVESPTKNDV